MIVLNVFEGVTVVEDDDQIRIVGKSDSGEQIEIALPQNLAVEIAAAIFRIVGRPE